MHTEFNVILGLCQTVTNRLSRKPPVLCYDDDVSIETTCTPAQAETDAEFKAILGLCQIVTNRLSRKTPVLRYDDGVSIETTCTPAHAEAGKPPVFRYDLRFPLLSTDPHKKLSELYNSALLSLESTLFSYIV